VREGLVTSWRIRPWNVVVPAGRTQRHPAVGECRGAAQAPTHGSPSKSVSSGGQPSHQLPLDRPGQVE
jgi:hypothetical protein